MRSAEAHQRLKLSTTEDTGDTELTFMSLLSSVSSVVESFLAFARIADR